jgi:hypothetical protein
VLSLRAYCLLPQTAAAEEKSVRSRNGEKKHFQVLAHQTTQENTHTKREREREREREATRRYDGRQPVIAWAEGRVSLGNVGLDDESGAY